MLDVTQRLLLNYPIKFRRRAVQVALLLVFKILFQRIQFSLLRAILASQLLGLLFSHLVISAVILLSYEVIVNHGAH
jgi:hypothetical protein